MILKAKGVVDTCGRLKKDKIMPVAKQNQNLTWLVVSLTTALAVATPVTSADWSGFLLGASIARQNASMDSSTGHDAGAAGLHLGYDLDFGQLVLGGELEVERAQIQLGSIETQEMQRIKLRVGYDFGQTLGYVAIGGVRAETELDDDIGAVIGLGMSYSLNQNLRVGGEILHQEVNGLENGGMMRSTSLSLRASFRF